MYKKGLLAWQMLILPCLIMATHPEYEIVVGLEVHAQLLTNSKLFSGDSIAFGADANTQVSPITLAHPGTLPLMNKSAIDLAIKIGLACNCRIEQQNYFARKNYFYPDLPKGYQISQHTTPICVGGYVPVQTEAGIKNVRLNRIHMEEDAGKSLHDIDDANTAVDYNRAGTPLVEIVTEPDISSSDEAFVYLTELRKMVRYLDVCDGNMEEGSMRCDANVSVRKKGDPELGTKVEVKNLNSIRNVKRAIDFEAARLIDLLEKGEPIKQQTRSFDAGNGTTFAIRDKEDADDYRYFADPDLTPFNLDAGYINSISATLPALHTERIARYAQDWQLPEYDATVITEERDFADYFEQVCTHTNNYKAAANWMLGPVKSWLNEQNGNINDLPITPAKLAAIIKCVDDGLLNFSSASSRLFTLVLQQPDALPEQLAKDNNLVQQSDAGELEPIIDAVLLKFEAKVQEYKKGKKGLLGLFVGEVVKQTKGKADPKKTNEILLEKLK